MKLLERLRTTFAKPLQKETPYVHVLITKIQTAEKHCNDAQYFSLCMEYYAITGEIYYGKKDRAF